MGEKGGERRRLVCCAHEAPTAKGTFYNHPQAVEEETDDIKETRDAPEPGCV
jgi:hypothetical protein